MRDLVTLAISVNSPSRLWIEPSNWFLPFEPTEQALGVARRCLETGAALAERVGLGEL